MTMVLINDFVIKKRIKMYYTPEEFKYIESIWLTSDKLLAELQTSEYFTGLSRWCDLEPSHYRFMIEQNLVMAESEENKLEVGTHAINSLNFLVCALIYCIESKLDANIEILRISRVNTSEVIFEFTGALQIEGKPKVKQNASFSIVVDNT